VCLAVGAGATSARVVAQSLTLSEVLLRVSQWTLTFEQQFGNRVADEVYEQRVMSSNGDVERSRHYTAELLFYRDALHDTWTSYRRVTTVDDEPVARAWMDPAETVPTLEKFLQDAERIDAESTRRFLGPMPWKLHLPMLALAFVHPLNRYRSRFEREGEEVVQGQRTWVVRFNEHRTPTFVRTRAGDLFASGRFWVVPDTGQVMRSDLVLGGSVSSRQARTRITVEYQTGAEDDVWVPVEMREVYDNPLFPAAARTEGHATFMNYRPFVLEDEATLIAEPVSVRP